MSDQLLVAAQKIQRETGCSFVTAWGIAQSENPGLVQSTRASEKPIETIEATHAGRMSLVSSAATAYPINDPDAADARLHDNSNGPEKARVDYSSGEKLLACAKRIQAANPGMSFSRAWEKAVAELKPVDSTPSGGFREGPQDLGGITISDVGPKTKAVDGFPKLDPNPLSGTVTSIRIEDPRGPA
jgi:hypothetical protein